MFHKFLGTLIKKDESKNMEVYLFPKKIEIDGLNQIVLFENSKEYFLNFTFQEKGKRLKIGDISVPKGSRKGYGSILMETLFEQTKGIDENEEIWGNLASEDEEHRKIQISFYEKHGFKIQDNIIKKIRPIK